MKYIKYFNEKFGDFVGQGTYNTVTDIDDDYVLKMPNKTGYSNNDGRLRVFDDHVKFMQKYPEIFPDVKRLDKRRASIEKLNTSNISKEYNKMIDLSCISVCDPNTNRINNYVFDITEEIHNKTSFSYTQNLFKFACLYEDVRSLLKTYIPKYPFFEKWIFLAELIGKSFNVITIKKFDLHSGNFGEDKNGKIKLIDW